MKSVFSIFLVYVLITMGATQKSQAQCSTGYVQIIIHIIPDTYPNETSWDLKDTANTIIASGTSNNDTLCYPTGKLLHFTIYDAYGDGMCCGYGNGSYNVYVDGNIVASGGAFKFNETTFFNYPPALISANIHNYYKQLMDHCNNINLLTPTQINALTDSIHQNHFYLADNLPLISAAFDLINCYETNTGPMFLNAGTTGGFPNNPGALDGFEYDRAIFLVQQELFEVLYTKDRVAKYRTFLNGRKYLTSNYFPGACPSPVDTAQAYTARVNASMPTQWGKPTAWSSTPARRPTGYYLAPGSIGSVKVPATMVNKGFKILVGAHSYDLSGRNNVKRFFRVSATFPITDTLTEIANPFGGGIYIITPYEAALGIVEVQLTNVVPAPFFSAKASSYTSLQEWKDVQRHHPAPWADFETDKYMMQVPTSWIYNYEDPVTLMQDWDNRMDVVSTLLGYPLARNNKILYLQVDCDIMYGYYGIGNPQINNIYDPLEVENGNKDHWFLRPGNSFWETEFHEMGHGQLFSKFPGETEAAVNLPAAAIYNRLYGMNIDTALGESFGNQPQITRDQAAMNWMVTPNFRAGNPMDISNTTKDEVRYQQRGYAKYVEMAALFGWEMIDSFYKKENLDFIAQTPGDSLTEVDSRILRFSRTAGADLRPLIHFWGVHPQDTAALKARIEAENLQPSKLICDRLVHYKAILPADNAEFLAHANTFFGGSIPEGGDPDYGSGWYNIWKTQYDSTLGTLGKQAMQAIIDLYFPDGCPAAAPEPNVTVTSQSICPGQSATLVASGAAYYQWSNGETGNSITVNPTATTTFTVIGKTAGISSAPVSAQVTVNPLPIVSANDAMICTGQTASLTATGAEVYNWSNGETSSSISVTPTETTTFLVIGTSLGCTSAPFSAQVIVNSLPTINLGADIVLQQGQEITLNAAAPGLTYQWSNGATNATIMVNSMGIYSVTVTNPANCTASDTILVTIIVSTTDPNEHFNLSIVPNPTSGLVSITCAGSSTTAVQVLDNLGRTITEDNAFLKDGATRILNIGQLPPGTYFIKIMGDHFFKTVPIIKQ
jgi:hypothetical protein